LQCFHAPLRDGGHGDCRAVKRNLAPNVSQSRVLPRVWGGGRGGLGAIEHGLATAPFDPPPNTAEPNLTYGTAAAKAPAGKVIWGRGAARQSRATLLSPPMSAVTEGEGLHQGIKRRIWSSWRGGREGGIQGRARVDAAGPACLNRTQWKGGRLGAPLPPPGHPSHAPLASSPM